MIALLKIFKKTKIKDGNIYEVTGAQPYAIYNNGKLEVPTEDDLIKKFPNNGRVFVADFFQTPQKEVFGIFELNDSNSYDESRPTSMKYLLGKEISNVKLLEVIDLDESIVLDKSIIVEKLTKGVNIPFHVSTRILFRTSDDFLIGPLQMEFIDGLYVVKDTNSNFIQYYQQEVDIVAILDDYKNQERLFCTNTLLQDSVSGWLDIADEQRVISDALKQLKDNAELSELSRKMIARLKEWYASDRARNPNLQERLRRAILIMENNTLPNEIVETFTNLVLDLQITNEIISKQTQLAFEREYEKFLKENERLIKECDNKKRELNKLNENYLKTSQSFKIAEFQYKELEKNMNNKIQQLKDNFSTIYAEQLKLSTFPDLAAPNNAPVLNNTLQGFTQYQTTKGGILADYEDFSNALDNNLVIFKGNDETKILAATIFTAITLEEPIIIYGENSYELAQCIAKTIACEQTLSIIPEIDKFSLDDLHRQYTQYYDAESVKSLIIHNPHTTSGLYSLPTYFKQSKWTDGVLLPNLIIITVDSLDEASSLVNRMLYKPLINSNEYMSHFINKRNIKTIQPSQMKLETVENTALDEYSLTVRREFREWIEDNQDMDKQIPYQLVEWLNQLGEFLDREVLYEACYKMFTNSILFNDLSVYEIEV